MRLLLDNNLSRKVADLLRAAGLDVVHVRDIGLHAAHDETVLAAARSDARVLVSADTDSAPCWHARTQPARRSC